MVLAETVSGLEREAGEGWKRKAHQDVEENPAMLYILIKSRHRGTPQNCLSFS